MNGGYESEGEDSRKEDTNNTVANSNRETAGSVQENTCSSAVSGNKGEETDFNDDTGTGGHESGGEDSRKEDTNNTVTNRNCDRAGSVKEDICSTAVSGKKGEETDLNQDTGTSGDQSKGDGSFNGDTDINRGHESGGDDSLKEDTNNTVTNSNRDTGGSGNEDNCSSAVSENEEEEKYLNEDTGTGGHESKGDCSLDEDRNSKTGCFGTDSEKILTDRSKGDFSLTEEIEKNVSNERKGEGLIKEDTNMTGKELKEVTSECDGLMTDGGNNVDGVRKELISTNESDVDQQVREETTEKGDSCEKVHGLGKIQVEIVEKDTTANSAKEKLESSVVDSSDDENLPLSELKLLSSKKHDKGQVDNQVCFTSDSYSGSLEGTEYNEGNGNTINRIIERLNDSEDCETRPMSMEEYRLTYDQDFFDSAVLNDDGILKDARREVGYNIPSQSDTSVTATSDIGNVSSDSEPELVIYRNKSNRRKKNNVDL